MLTKYCCIRISNRFKECGANNHLFRGIQVSGYLFGKQVVFILNEKHDIEYQFLANINTHKDYKLLPGHAQATFDFRNN